LREVLVLEEDLLEIMGATEADLFLRREKDLVENGGLWRGRWSAL
jgi:hypothetical protein